MTKITVVTTFYNASKYLEAAIKSIMSQSYQEYEHLLINDGSTDDSVHVVQKYLHAKCRILSPGKIGRAKALNFGLNHAQGEYIAILDADDIAMSSRLMLQKNRLDQDQTITLCCSNVTLIDKEGKTTGQTNFPLNHDGLVEHLLKLNPFTHSSVMFRKDKVLSFGGYNDRCEKSIDYNLYLELLANGGRLAGEDLPLVQLRSYPDSWGKSDSMSLQIRYGILGLINFCFVTQNKGPNFMRGDQVNWNKIKSHFDQWFQQRGFGNKWEAKKHLNGSRRAIKDGHLNNFILNLYRAIKLDPEVFFYRGCGFKYPEDVYDFIQYLTKNDNEKSVI